ncbi:MAG: AsmA family protein [Candidatus Sulfotelmatobacter sp.]
MNRRLKIVAIVVAVLIVIVIAIPFFIDVNAFRPKLESELTDTLGRPVKVGNLALSLLSGSVTADNISIADDPAFSKTPFVQAKSLKVGVEVIPLIFSKSLNVTELTLNQPEISLVRSQDGEKWNFSSLGNTGAASNSAAQPNTSSPSSSNPNLSIGKLAVNNGRLTLSRAGSSQQPRVYDKVDIEMSHFSFANSFPFKVSASLPAGGALKLDGNAGPVNAANAALTPLQAKVTITQMNLAASGFIDPASGIAGIADFNGTVASDGHEAKTSGTLKADKLQVVQKGSPAGKPVQLQYSVTYDLVKQAGTLTGGEIAMGKAVAHLSGTYDAHGATTVVNMKLNGQGLPVDDLEAMLPAVGVILPSGSQLKGGTLSTDFTIVGPVDKLVTTGTVRLENSALAGFNLGSKLSAISALSGKGAAAQQKDTTIQNFSANVRVAPEGTRADNISLIVPTLGNASGAGTVSPSNALDFKMKADNIPFLIQGTTSDPKFVPDVKGMAGSLLQNALGGKAVQKNPLGGVTGMLKKP